MTTQVQLPKFNSKETKSNKYILDGQSYYRVTSILNAINKPALMPWKAQITLEKAERVLVSEVLGKYIATPDAMDEISGIDRDNAQAMVERQNIDEHATLIDQTWIDSVIETARAEPDYVLGTATTFGSDAHYALEQYIANGKVPHDLDMYRVIGAFQSWAKANQIELLPDMCEVTVAHPEVKVRDMFNPDWYVSHDLDVISAIEEELGEVVTHAYAGTIDAVAIKGDELVIVDWKTSNGLYAEHMLQVAAYARALKNATGMPVNEAWIVRFPRAKPETGEPDFNWVHLGPTELNKNFQLFRNAQKLYLGTQLAAGERALHDGTGVLPERKKKS